MSTPTAHAAFRVQMLAPGGMPMHVRPQLTVTGKVGAMSSPEVSRAGLSVFPAAR
jgi:hypothetical protein